MGLIFLLCKNCLELGICCLLQGSGSLQFAKYFRRQYFIPHLPQHWLYLLSSCKHLGLGLISTWQGCHTFVKWRPHLHQLACLDHQSGWLFICSSLPLPIIRYCFSTFHKGWYLISSCGQLPPLISFFWWCTDPEGHQETPAKALGPIHTAVKKSSRIWVLTKLPP